MIEFFNKWSPDLLFISSGIIVNIKYTFIAISIGLILGAFLAFSKKSNIFILRAFANFYTSIFRGTPLIIQISIIYYVLPGVLDTKISVFAAAVISFSFNSAAYVSEILRSGLNSVEVGQIEASRALGVPEHITMRDIILPQAIRKILPALVNEFVNLLKETSLISIIGEAEVLRRAQMVASQKYNYVVPMLTAALSYYIVVLILVHIAGKLENKLKL